MPRVYHDDKTAGGDAKAAQASDKITVDPRAADVAAYLETLGTKADKAAEVPADEKVQAGGVLYATLNCIACHTPPDAMPAPEAGAGNANGGNGEQADADTALASKRIPHKYVRAKFTPAGLKQYLLNPHAHYAWNPMPNFRLTEQEADNLSAYLLANGEEKPPVNGDVPAGDPAKGRQLVATSGCLNCHMLGTEQSQAKAPALAELSKSGWAQGLAKGGDFHATGPRYELTDEQRAAVVAFAATGRSSLGRESPPEFAERQVRAMRCIACHMRDGKESLLATALDQEQKDLEAKFPPPQPANAEAFAPDQRAPMLTWVGEKLRPEWMAAFIGGQIPYKPRPYLRARMPAFTARAVGLAQGLAEEHGYGPTSEEYPKPDPKTAAVGQTLAGRTPNQAFACVQCHAVANLPPFTPFEAPSVNFMYSRERLRKDYYHRWVHDPIKLDPNTKMPKFERDDGKTPITTVYDGDARKQFEAIWQYLLEGREIKAPAE
jgi:mono/diheme cytochrome c family protein